MACREVKNKTWNRVYRKSRAYWYRNVIKEPLN